MEASGHMVRHKPPDTRSYPLPGILAGVWFAEQLSGAANSERGFFIKWGLILYLLWILAFEALGRYAAGLPTHDLTNPLDRQIPLIPIFIWPYVFCYLFPFLLAFVVHDWHRVCRGILSILFANLTAFIVYLAYPVAFPKPELGGSVSECLIRIEYVADFHPGANNLPSLHVAFAWLIYLICRKQGMKRIAEHALLLVALLITVSTLFVKQHILVDVVAGAIWALASWFAAGFFYPRWTARGVDAKAALCQTARRSMPFVAITAALMVLMAFCR